MSNRIFISYRREDSAAWAGRLYDQLAAHFGPRSIFIDVDDIDPGLDFVVAIETAISQTNVLVVVIGPSWLDIVDTEGNRRLDDSEDFVRLEITTALKRNIRVIPVLIGGATMPGSADLPIDLKSLARRNAIKLNHSSFSSDVQRLILGLERAIKEAEAESSAEEKETGPKARKEVHAAMVSPGKEIARGTHIEKETSVAQPEVSGKKRAIQVFAALAIIAGGLIVASRFFVTPDNDNPQVVQESPKVSSKEETQLSKIHQQGDTMTEKITGMELVYVSKGCFQMGSLTKDSDEQPVHEVCLDGYWIGKHEVTQGQWISIMDANPAVFQKGRNYPVESVSWDLIQSFISLLNEKSGWQFRLPTEAEWEYACQANGQGQFCGGDNIEDLAWYSDNSDKSTHPTGVKLANGFDLHDMSGNVWEWCQDWYGSDYYRVSPHDNPQGPSSGSDRVIRGGSWNNDDMYVRSAFRGSDLPASHYDFLGFRLVLPSGQ